MQDFNPRAPCGARRIFSGTLLDKVFISIHAPRAGRDEINQTTNKKEDQHFNPRAPSGARLLCIGRGDRVDGFQSTRPVRGATHSRFSSIQWRFISIHAPRAGRDTLDKIGSLHISHFNPRAPCGARRLPFPRRWTRQRFQSTRPVRGATFFGFQPPVINLISIHAPRAGRDEAIQNEVTFRGNFNPRAPCGARQQKYTKLLYTLLRQKAIFRQFHAKRRLLKRFSTYKYRNTFLICSANRMGKICTLPLRTTRSLDLPEGMSACNQSARFCFRTFFPSSKTADYPAPDP